MTRRRDWIAAYRERLQHRIDRAPEDVAYRILRARVPFEGTLVEDLAPVRLPPRVSEEPLVSVAAVVLATPGEPARSLEVAK